MTTSRLAPTRAHPFRRCLAPLGMVCGMGRPEACHLQDCTLAVDEHPPMPEHPFYGCDEYHGVPGEEPGCYGADLCHADDCMLTRECHREMVR
jgi:hypothetical protein